MPESTAKKGDAVTTGSMASSQGILAVTAFGMLAVAAGWFYFFIQSRRTPPTTSTPAPRKDMADSLISAVTDAPTVHPVGLVLAAAQAGKGTVPASSTKKTPSAGKASLIKQIQKGDLNDTPV